MADISTVLWDVDGTLLDFLYAQRCAITKALRTAGYDATDEMVARYSEINDGYWKRFERGEVTKQELLTGRFVRFFEVYGLTGIDVSSFSSEYLEELGEVYAYIDDSLTLCRRLKEKVKQYVVTNGVAKTQMKKLRKSGFYDVMDGIFISEQIGVPKPYKEYFDYCFERIGETDKSRILLVGDSLTSDIKGGVCAGIKTCWYKAEGMTNDSAYQADYEITDLQEVLNIIGVV